MRHTEVFVLRYLLVALAEVGNEDALSSVSGTLRGPSKTVILVECHRKPCKKRMTQKM
jgi:hypothetical protein